MVAPHVWCRSARMTCPRLSVCGTGSPGRSRCGTVAAWLRSCWPTVMPGDAPRVGGVGCRRGGGCGRRSVRVDGRGGGLGSVECGVCVDGGFGFGVPVAVADRRDAAVGPAACRWWCPVMRARHEGQPCTCVHCGEP